MNYRYIFVAEAFVAVAEAFVAVAEAFVAVAEAFVAVAGNGLRFSRRGLFVRDTVQGRVRRVWTP